MRFAKRVFYLICLLSLTSALCASESSDTYTCFNEKSLTDYAYNRTVFNETFLNNYVYNRSVSETPRIPKIIHHIWFGSPVPKKYQRYINSYKKFHPDWEHKLWTNKDIGTFPLITGNKIHKLKNYGHKSDIFRLELLYRFGGLYVDTDFLCLKPHDPIHHVCDFYVSSFSNKRASNSFIASKPNHPIIKDYLYTIKNTDLFSTSNRSVLKQTGPFLLTKVLLNYLKRSNNGVIVFPPIYFYPAPAKIRQTFWKNQNLKLLDKYVTSDSFAVHLFATSWQK